MTALEATKRLETGLEQPPGEDLPHVADPCEPAWTESFAFWANDAASSTAVFIHFQRQPQSAVWRALVAVYPDRSSVLLAKAYGIPPSPSSAGAGPAFHTSCEVPFSTWRLFYDGAARHVALADLNQGPLTDGPSTPLRLDLRFAASAPAWSSAESELQVWASAHYEQPGTVTGLVGIAENQTRFHGQAWRDHSYGPRDLGSIPDCQWVHGEFPGGRSFVLLQMRNTEEFQSAYVAENGRMYKADMTVAAPFGAPADGDSFEVVLAVGTTEHRITCTYIASFPMSCFPPHDQVFGASSSNDVVLTYFSSIVRSEWDGETGYGFANPTLSSRHKGSE